MVWWLWEVYSGYQWFGKCSGHYWFGKCSAYQWFGKCSGQYWFVKCSGPIGIVVTVLGGGKSSGYLW